MTDYDDLNNNDLLEAIRQSQDFQIRIQRLTDDFKTGKCLPTAPVARLAMIDSFRKLLHKQSDELEALFEAGRKPQKLRNS